MNEQQKQNLRAPVPGERRRARTAARGLSSPQQRVGLPEVQDYTLVRSNFRYCCGQECPRAARIGDRVRAATKRLTIGAIVPTVR
jgi:hypothetical protein